MDESSGLSPKPDSVKRAPATPVHSFASTQWSVVVQAQDRDAPEAQAALTTLCEIYWYPIYVYLRRRTNSQHDAEELTQEFFTLFLEKDVVLGAEPTKGKFRAYLLACCKHFLANHYKRERAEIHGGGKPILSLDVKLAGERYQLEPVETLTPEKLFERRWAFMLLENALAQLAQEHEQSNKEALYEELKPHLTKEADAAPYAEAAERLGMTEPAVRQAARRLRQRFKTILRAQISATVESPDLIADEIRDLFAVLGG